MWSKLCASNGRLGIHILGSKLLFHHTFEDELKLAELHGHIARGRFTPRRTNAAGATFDLLSLLHEAGALVVKPIDGQKGKSVHVLAAKEAGALELDGRAVTAQELAAWLGRQDSMLVHARVQQTGYAHAIFPGSANTVRIVTVTDADGPFVLCGSHRFGRQASAPVDNFAAGGLLCGIDLATGALSLGASSPAVGESHLTWHSVHPDTGTQVAGQVVPGFFELVDLLLATCRRHPYLAYVGWDVVMTDDGPVVLEANYGSGLQLQLNGGFLRNERFARFVESVRASERGARWRHPSG
ncbi:MAG TPA: sugar-transfer associated ATP-grasp domain-containing protein, partial [Trueperaceae bacterium]|nr:sugar-transfer associated ATP-grasp domain-containing protein [Trueperaceae bacterium]